jgi:hypothetical protein
MRHSRRWIWPALGAALACAADPAAPELHQRFDPPAEYREWFAQTEACSRLSGDFERLRFYRVPGNEFPCPSGMCVARWIDSHQIYVAEAFLEDEMVLRHEMLHDLIGQPGHPDPPFGQSGCGLTWTSWSGRVAGVPHID